jgi:hypothetical protein
MHCVTGRRAKLNFFGAAGRESFLRGGFVGFLFFSQGMSSSFFAVCACVCSPCRFWSSVGRSLSGCGWYPCDEYDDPHPWHWESHLSSYESCHRMAIDWWRDPAFRGGSSAFRSCFFRVMIIVTVCDRLMTRTEPAFWAIFLKDIKNPNPM